MESSQAGRKPAARSPLRLSLWGSLGQALFGTKMEGRSRVFPRFVTRLGSKVPLPKSNISHFNNRFILMVAMDLPGMDAKIKQDLRASKGDGVARSYKRGGSWRP